RHINSCDNFSRRDLMKLHNHFLPDDMEEASKEFWCIKDLIIKLKLQLDRGNTEGAKHTSIDLTKSLHELTKLSEKKYRQEKNQEAVNLMAVTAVHFEVLRRLNNE